MTALLVLVAALVLVLGAQVRLDLGPVGFPAVATEDIAERQHGIDVGGLPVHTGAFEPGFDDILIGTFHHAAPDRPPLLAKLRVKHLALPLFQIGEVPPQQLERGVLCLLLPQFCQEWLRPLMFEAMQPVLRPLLCLASVGARACLADFTDALCGIWSAQGCSRRVAASGPTQPTCWPLCVR